MHIGDFHQAPVHAYRARIVDMYDDPGTYAPAYYRLALCKCGSGEFYDDNDTPHEVGAGDMFWFTPGTPRKWRRTSKGRWIVSYIAKVVFRKTPKEYVTEYCMERAKSKLLRHPNRSVRQIAKEVGYADAASFAEVFKKYSGYSPNDYRNINL